MSTPEDKDAKRKERDAERKKEAEQARLRDARSRRIKDIGWTALLASVITIIVVTALGWLTTQAVVEEAREEGREELVALRASICLVRFQQLPTAEEKLAEFKALSWNEREDAIRNFVVDEGLATMLGQDEPAPGAVDKCVDAIRRSS